MTKKTKKSAAVIGTVLRKVSDLGALKAWAEHMVSIEPWKSLEYTAERLLERWNDASSRWSFYSAANPRGAKLGGGFDNEQGLIVFAADGGRAIVEQFLKKPLPAELGEGGYVQAIVTKLRKKGVGKYLLHAAERVISEKHKRVYLFVSETNTAAQRFYKSAGYEQVDRAIDCLKPGNNELLFTKLLES